MFLTFKLWLQTEIQIKFKLCLYLCVEGTLEQCQQAMQHISPSPVSVLWPHYSITSHRSKPASYWKKITEDTLAVWLLHLTFHRCLHTKNAQKSTVGKQPACNNILWWLTCSLVRHGLRATTRVAHRCLLGYVFDVMQPAVVSVQYVIGKANCIKS